MAADAGRTVQLAYLKSGLAPVTGTFGATGQSASFIPVAGRGMNVSVWGAFVGTVYLARSFDGGTTWLPITAGGVQLYKYTAPASESLQDDEFGVSYALICSGYTSGTINYRLSQ